MCLLIFLYNLIINPGKDRLKFYLFDMGNVCFDLHVPYILSVQIKLCIVYCVEPSIPF